MNRHAAWEDRTLVIFITTASRWRRLSLHSLAAVDHHGVADHESSRVRAQPDDGRGNLLGLAHPPDRLFRNHLRAPFGCAPGEATHHRGIDVAGADDVDPDVLRCVVESRRLRQANHTVLRGGVRGTRFGSRKTSANALGIIPKRMPSSVQSSFHLAACPFTS
jgi:hypothetical protein